MELVKRLSCFIMLFALISCGGGGDLTGNSNNNNNGNNNGNNGGSSAPTIALTISNVTVTEQTPATVSATVTNNGQAVSGVVVTFVTTLGDFTPSSGTALTNDNGLASIILNAGEQAGAGTVTATLPSSESASIGFTTQGATQAVVRLGSGSPFVENVAQLSLDQISAGGTSVVSVSLVDQQGQPFTESVDLQFTSRCTEETPAAASLSSPVNTSSGQATSTYLARGCVGDDLITVNAVVGSQNLSATATVNVLPADIGSIEFVSATPEIIAIQGTGSAERPESSTVVFRVLDTNGDPVNNRRVDFSLNSATGGVVLGPDSATTDQQGLVQTVVNSGTVSRTIRVTADVNGSDPLISTQSSELIISTGIPDQDSFSLSVSTINAEGWQTDGTNVAVTARLADAFNNPPPPTVVFFTTEGGSIDDSDSSCVTDSTGACSVTWRSQNPRPTGQVLTNSLCTPNQDADPTILCARLPVTTDGVDVNGNPIREGQNYLGQSFGGRVSLLATTIGEESFPDLNGNGRFDVCEVVAFTGGTGKPCNPDGTINENGPDIVYTGNDVGGMPYDLKEAFVDHNEDGLFNPAEPGGQSGGEQEEPSDFNQNGIFDGKNGQYNGVLCAEPQHEGCAQEKSLDVRGQAIIIMSGSNPYITVQTPTITILGEGSAVASIILADLHNQPMPAGTTLLFSSTVGTVQAGATQDVPNTDANGGQQFQAVIGGASEPATGTLFVEIETPSGLRQGIAIATIIIR